jgi:hypothetical protein
MISRRTFIRFTGLGLFSACLSPLFSFRKPRPQSRPIVGVAHLLATDSPLKTPEQVIAWPVYAGENELKYHPTKSMQIVRVDIVHPGPPATYFSRSFTKLFLLEGDSFTLTYTYHHPLLPKA